MRQNGRFCKTGLAALQDQEFSNNDDPSALNVKNQSMCTSVDTIKQVEGNREPNPKASSKYKTILADKGQLKNALEL
jgi:hypothetical protein